MKTQHTPAPWVANGAYIHKQDRGLKSKIANTMQLYAGGSMDEAHANASHIVKCVNIHDDLVRALYDLLNSDADGGINTSDTIEFAKETLAKAKGESK